MNDRDYDYIERRLYPTGEAIDAAARLRRVGLGQLADTLLAVEADHAAELAKLRQALRESRRLLGV